MKVIEIAKGRAVVELSSAEVFRLSRALDAITHQYNDIDHAILRSSSVELEDLNEEFYEVINSIGRYESKNL